MFSCECQIAKVPPAFFPVLGATAKLPHHLDDLPVMKNGQPLKRALPSNLAFAMLLIGCAAIVVSSGCRQPVGGTAGGPRLFGGGQIASNNSQQSNYVGNQLVSQGANKQYAEIANEFDSLNRRLGAYDSDNQLLNTEIAALQQKLQLASQYNSTIKQQLADTAGRIQKSEMEKQAALQQLAVARQQLEQLGNDTRLANSGSGQLAAFGGNNAPTKFAGGATIRANNSLMQRLSEVQITGGQARMDGDVIRIEFPSDRMFVPGTYQIQPNQLPVMQSIAATIRQNFPRQIVGIEAHWDNTPLNPPTTTHHQLTATQALAVFDNLVRLGLPSNQIFTMAMASNRPRHPRGQSGGISPNRRIELVIYPETFDGSN